MRKKDKVIRIRSAIIFQRRQTLPALVCQVLLFSIFLCCCFFSLSCRPKTYTDTAFFMGTFVEVTSSNPQAKEVVFREFERVEKMCSLFDENSELSRLNSSGDLVASKEFFDILEKAQMYYETTDGAFDVTIAPLSLLWKKAFLAQELPREEDIKQALSCVGSDYIYLDDKNLSVKLLKMGVKLDLGGMAKGYAVDSSIAKLKALKIDSAIVNAGGDIYCLGENDKRPWRVGIQDPRNNKNIIETLQLENKAVATSGDYEQFFIFQDKRYSHIINPSTGYPAVSGIISASVIAKDALTADVLATAFVVLGYEKSLPVINRFQDAQAKLIADQGRILNLSTGLKR